MRATGTAPADELASLVERTRGLQPWRRAFHVGNGLVVALAPGIVGLEGPRVGWVLAPLVALLLAADVARLRVRRLNVLFFRSFPSLASPREAASVASSTWYALGALITWAAFPPAVAVPAILVLALADPVASVAGRLTGTRRLGKGSVQGTAAFFVVASCVLLVALRHPVALAVAAAVALVETAPLRLDDNLTVPLTAALFLWLLVP